jgi:hypothetical protein
MYLRYFVIVCTRLAHVGDIQSVRALRLDVWS